MPKLQNTLVILPYDPNWKTEFERIRDFLMDHIGDLIIKIEHIGSTSVPGLCAKPIIDLVAVIESYDVFPQIVSRLEKIGFQHEGDKGIKEREAFRRIIPDDFMDYHFYVCPKNSKEYLKQTRFRNALIKNPQIAEEYGKLKTRLVGEVNGDRVLYTNSKTDFILNVINRVYDNGDMKNISQNIYDNQTFFDGYKKLRENPDNANLLEEKPALFSLAPDLTGLSVLDLGCGYGENCAEFLRLGAAKVVGIDISAKMLEVAKRETSGVEYIHADMSDLSVIEGNFDVVFSSLAIHYIEDFGKLCAQVFDLLNPHGYFIFSQEHPFTTAPLKGASWTKNENGERLHYNLSDYQRCGKREMTWFIDGVIKYHRTFSEVVNTLLTTGFSIEGMLEPAPSEELIDRLPYYADELHKPNFLLIKVRKK
jgi:GrpB-like predicted nucleotidyltransferase (UPF0157 family)/ubiquinone/menaquinone biosynthesis C-methylase UbiE